MMGSTIYLTVFQFQLFGFRLSENQRLPLFEDILRWVPLMAT